MLAHVCWYLPGGEFVCERNAELTPLPKGDTGAVWRADVEPGLGVSVGWRAILNQSGSYRVGAVRLGAGVIEVTLVKAKGGG